jgi:hypothetical protein
MLLLERTILQPRHAAAVAEPLLSIFYQAQVPDVDAVVHTADFPCVKKSPATQDYKRPYELERVCCNMQYHHLTCAIRLPLLPCEH